MCQNQCLRQIIFFTTENESFAIFSPFKVFTDNEVRPGEKRISCMLFDAKHDRLITGMMMWVQCKAEKFLLSCYSSS